jgi:hypothetical protein
MFLIVDLRTHNQSSFHLLFNVICITQHLQLSLLPSAMHHTKEQHQKGKQH